MLLLILLITLSISYIDAYTLGNLFEKVKGLRPPTKIERYRLITPTYFNWIVSQIYILLQINLSYYNFTH